MAGYLNGVRREWWKYLDGSRWLMVLKYLGLFLLLQCNRFQLAKLHTFQLGLPNMTTKFSGLHAWVQLNILNIRKNYFQSNWIQCEDWLHVIWKNWQQFLWYQMVYSLRYGRHIKFLFPISALRCIWYLGQSHFSESMLKGFLPFKVYSFIDEYQ